MSQCTYIEMICVGMMMYHCNCSFCLLGAPAALTSLETIGMVFIALFLIVFVVAIILSIFLIRGQSLPKYLHVP